MSDATMHVHITPHHLALTPSLRRFAADKVAALSQRVSEIATAHVVLLHEGAHAPDSRFSARVRLAVPGRDVHACESDADLYAAIDKVVDKLARRLRKRKTRGLRRHESPPRTLSGLRHWPQRGRR